MSESGFDIASSTQAQCREWYATWQARLMEVQAASKQDGASLRQRVPFGSWSVHDVWTWNFEEEFQQLIAVTGSAKEGAVLALDTQFPGLLCQESHFSAQSKQYEALRSNIDLLQPIQFGIAVASIDGIQLGAWRFNMHFDVGTNLYVDASLAVLEAVGIDFQRHASEGIDATLFGGSLAGSALVGIHEDMPQWITFDGIYDFGYLLKLLTGHPLPKTLAGFHMSLNDFCPRRFDLRERMLHGSLEHWMRMFGVEHKGDARTVSSAAGATLELYFITTAAPLKRHSQQQQLSSVQPPPGLEAPSGLEQPLKVEALEPPPGLPDTETMEYASGDGECAALSSMWAAAAIEAVIEGASANSTTF